VRITVLGGCGGYPEAGRAASGFLVEHDGFRVVLDLGYATLPRLLAHCPDGAVDAVVITHEHPDHCVDLNALDRVRHFRGGPDRARIPLYCPPGVLDRVGALEPDSDLRDSFAHHPLPAGAYRVGPFTLTSVLLPHHVPNAGIRLAASDAVLAYTGDTGPTPLLTELGADADLYIVDATHQGGTPRLLLTAGLAGEYATRAGARRLMLTHIWPGSDRGVSVVRARQEYAGEILVADEETVVEV